MRILKINNEFVEIDDNTVIAIDFQAYDIKNPGKRFVNVSNSFSIPKTSKNLSVFGNPSDPQSTSQIVYAVNSCSYWVDNQIFINNAKCRIDSISDRIYLFIFDKPEIWDILKSVKWSEFIPDFLEWMNVNYDLPIATDPYTGNYNNFLDNYYEANEGILLPYYLTNGIDYLWVGQKQKERLQILGTTVIGNPELAWVFTSTTTGTITGTTTLVHGMTMSDVAEAMATSMGGNSDFNNYASANAVGDYVEITCNEAAINDASIDFGYTITLGAGVTDNSGSQNMIYGYPSQAEAKEHLFPVTTYGKDAQLVLAHLSDTEDCIMGHFSIFIKTIFEYIESVYNVDFGINRTFDNNIWADAVATKMFIPAQSIAVHIESGNCYFYTKTATEKFLPLKDVEDKPDKTLYDLTLSFFQHLHVIIDTLNDGANSYYALRRFDELENSTILDWSGGIGSVIEYNPYVEDYSQNNYIRFKTIYEQGNPDLNSRNITCGNLNLDHDSDLFAIDAYIPPVVGYRDYFVSLLNAKESFKTFVFYVWDRQTTNDVSIFYYNWKKDQELVKAYVHKLRIAELYDLNSEYLLIEQALQEPKFYKCEKWLKSSDIRNLEFFRLVFIKELNGSFFLNKISGFNPDKALTPTKLELFRISDKTPSDLGNNQDYWVDGDQNYYGDDNEDKFI